MESIADVMTWEFDWETYPGLLIMLAAGPMTLASLKAMRAEAHSDPRFAEIDGHIADCRLADPTGLAAEDIRTLTATSERPDRASAVVVTPGLAFGLASMYARLSERVHDVEEIGVHTSFDAALAWIRTRLPLRV